MITPDDLRAELERLGLAVSLRTLTDWRAKGLLPLLEKKGLGRGKGTQQGWLNPEIVDQAIATHFLLKRYSNTQAALLSLWSAGYSVPTNGAKNAWLSRLDRELKSHQKHAKKWGGYSLLISGWIKRAVKRKYVNPSIYNSLDFSDFITEAFGLAIDPEFDFDLKSTSTLIIDVFKLESTHEVYANVDEVLEVLRPLLMAALPIYKVRKTVESITIDELESIHKQLKVLHSIFRQWVKLLSPEIHREQLVFISVMALEATGRFFARCLIQLQRNELDDLFIESANVIERFTKSLSQTDVIRLSEHEVKLSESGLEQKERLKTELEKIWSNWDLKPPPLSH